MGPTGAVGLPGQSVVRAAFDGYPTRLDQPYPPNQWRTDPAKKGEPLSVTIFYPQPVAVTRFIHYLDETPPSPAAWKDVEIQVSDDLMQWRTLQQLHDLPAQSPQILGIDQPTLGTLLPDRDQESCRRHRSDCHQRDRNLVRDHHWQRGDRR